MVFISYRHADNSEEDRNWATWLHQTLEVYDIPEELIGTTNSRGEIIPERIYPVFRDEVSLPASADLNIAINEAVDRSKFMIVLCSPRAVQSPYVSSEVIRFKSTGKSNRLMAAILLGEPNASTRSDINEDPEDVRTLECFPEPLRYDVDKVGNILKEQVTEPIAVDFRLPDGNKGLTNPGIYARSLIARNVKRKDAQKAAANYEFKITNAKLKLIAGILGVPLEILSKRDKEYQLRRSEIARKKAVRTTVAISVLLISAIIAWLTVLWKNDQLDTATQLANQRADEADRSSLSAKRAESLLLVEKANELSDPLVKARVLLRGLPRSPDFSDRPFVGDVYNLLAQIFDEQNIRFPVFPQAPQYILSFGSDKELKSHYASNDKRSFINIYSDSIQALGKNNTIDDSISHILLSDDAFGQDFRHNLDNLTRVCTLSDDLTSLLCSQQKEKGSQEVVLTKIDSASGKVISNISVDNPASIESVSENGSKVILNIYPTLTSDNTRFSDSTPPDDLLSDYVVNVNTVIWDTHTNKLTPLELPKSDPTQHINKKRDALDEIFYDLDTGNIVFTIINSQSNRVISKLENIIWIHNINDGKLLREIKTYNENIKEVLINDNGSRLCILSKRDNLNYNKTSGDTNYLLKIFNTETGGLLNEHTFSKPLSSSSYISDGNNKNPKGWSTVDGEWSYQVWPDQKGEVFVINEDNDKGEGEQLIRLSGIHSNAEILPLQWIKTIVNVDYSADGELILILDNNGIAHIFRSSDFTHAMSYTLGGTLNQSELLSDIEKADLKTSYIDYDNNLVLVTDTGLTIKSSLTNLLLNNNYGFGRSPITEKLSKLAIDEKEILGISEENNKIITIESDDSKKNHSKVKLISTTSDHTVSTQVDWDREDIKYLNFSDNYERLIVSTYHKQGKTTEVLDLTTKTFLRNLSHNQFDGRDAELSSVSLSKNGNKLSYCITETDSSNDRLVLDTLLPNNNPKQIIYDLKNTNLTSPRCIGSSWMETDTRLALIVKDSKMFFIFVIDTRTMKVEIGLPIHETLDDYQLFILTSSPDGRYLPIVDNWKDLLLILDTKTGLVRNTLSLNADIKSVNWSLDGNYALILDEDNENAILFDIKSDRILWEAPKNTDTIIASRDNVWLKVNNPWFHTTISQLANSPSSFAPLEPIPLFQYHLLIEPTISRFIATDKIEHSSELELKVYREPWIKEDIIKVPATSYNFATTLDDGIVTYLNQDNISMIRINDTSELNIPIPNRLIAAKDPKPNLITSKNGRLIIAHNRNELYIVDTKFKKDMARIIESDYISSVRSVGENRTLALSYSVINNRSNKYKINIVDVLFNDDSSYKLKELPTHLEIANNERIILFPAPTGYLLLSIDIEMRFSALLIKDNGDYNLLYDGILSNYNFTQSRSLNKIAINTNIGVVVLDLTSNENRYVISHDGDNTVHAFSFDSNYLFTGSSVDGIRQFDMLTGANMGFLQKPGAKVSNILVDNKGESIAAFLEPSHVLYLPILTTNLANQIADLRLRIPKSIPDSVLLENTIGKTSTIPIYSNTCNTQTLNKITEIANISEQHLALHLASKTHENKDNTDTSSISKAAKNLSHATRIADNSGCRREVVNMLLERQSRITSGINIDEAANIWFNTDKLYKYKRLRL